MAFRWGVVGIFFGGIYNGIFYISLMEKIITALKNMPGIFGNAFELRSNPLLEDIYEDITDLDKLQYIGPEMDRINLRNDMHNWANDFGKALQAAKQRLGV